MARNNYPQYAAGTNIFTDADDSAPYIADAKGACSPTQTVSAGQKETSGATEIMDEPTSKARRYEPTDVMQGATEIDDVVPGNDIPQTVGWLICVKGKCRGRDFRLHNGWNYIGRSSNSDVCVDDPKVSATMARVSYDARNRAFAISSSERATNLTYCNSKAVYNTVEINAYDVISMGDTDFVFVPLCGPHFTWEE